jgi:hypothetical protein
MASILLLSSLIFTIISTCRADYNVTVYPESSPSLFKYVGDWTSGASTETIGDSAAFNFTGDEPSFTFLGVSELGDRKRFVSNDVPQSRMRASNYHVGWQELSL